MHLQALDGRKDYRGVREKEMKVQLEEKKQTLQKS